MFGFFSCKNKSVFELEQVVVEDDDYILMTTEELLKDDGEIQIGIMQEKSIDELLKINLENYEQPLPSKVIDEIIERIKLNLVESDLLRGVKEILEENNIKIAKPKYFDNFIVGCKLLYEIRKQFSIASSSEALNQFKRDIRKDVMDFHYILRQHITKEEIKSRKKGIVHIPRSDRLLAKLKINDTIVPTEERILKNYGFANCGSLSVVGLKTFLKIQSSRAIEAIILKNDDHTYLKLYSDQNKNTEDACFIDAWKGRVGSEKQMHEIVKGHLVDDTEAYWNSTYEINLEKASKDIVKLDEEILSFDKDGVLDDAIDSLTCLQNAAEGIVADILQYMKKPDSNIAIFAFLNKKEEDLMSFSQDIQFAIQAMAARNLDPMNISVVNEFNDQIENFYKVLFYKILRAPMGSNIKETDIAEEDRPVTNDTIALKPFMHSPLFDNEFLPEIKDKMKEYTNLAANVINLALQQAYEQASEHTSKMNL